MLQKSLLTAILCSAMAVGVAAQSESNPRKRTQERRKTSRTSK